MPKLFPINIEVEELAVSAEIEKQADWYLKHGGKKKPARKRKASANGKKAT